MSIRPAKDDEQGIPARDYFPFWIYFARVTEAMADTLDGRPVLAAARSFLAASDAFERDWSGSWPPTDRDSVARALREYIVVMHERDDFRTVWMAHQIEMWSIGTRSALDDPTGEQGRAMLRDFGIDAPGDAHLRALWWLFERRAADGGDIPNWQRRLDDDPHGFPTWVRSSILAFARPRAAGAHDDGVPLDDLPEHAHPVAAETVGAGEALAMAHAWLQDLLGEAERETLLLSMDDLSNEEIADRLGVSRGAVDTRLSRARKKISGTM